MSQNTMYFLFIKYIIQKNKNECVFISKHNGFTRKWEEVKFYNFPQAVIFTMLGFGIMKDSNLQILE